jgi:hypothetical protein
VCFIFFVLSFLNTTHEDHGYAKFIRVCGAIAYFVSLGVTLLTFSLLYLKSHDDIDKSLLDSYRRGNAGAVTLVFAIWKLFWFCNERFSPQIAVDITEMKTTIPSWPLMLTRILNSILWLSVGIMIGDLVLTIFHSFQVFGSALQLLAVVVFQWESVCSATRLWWNIFRDFWYKTQRELHQHNSEGIPREHEGEVAAVPCVAVVPVATVLAESMEPDVTVVGTV